METLKTAPFEAVDPKGELVEIAQVVELPPRAARGLPEACRRQKVCVSGFRSKPYDTSKPGAGAAHRFLEA